MSDGIGSAFQYSSVDDLLAGLACERHNSCLLEIPQNTQSLRNRLSFEKRVVLLTGPSGAGKDTVLNSLPEDRYVRWRTVTTRADVRADEAGDDPYVRYSREQFLREAAQGMFIEYNEYAGNLYGTHRAQASAAFADGRVPVLRVDPSGAANFNNFFEDQVDPFHEASLIHFFIAPPNSVELTRRLEERDSDPVEVTRRLKKAEQDLKHIGNSHFVLINDTNKLSETVEAILYCLDQLSG